ncbi:MAG TPA: DUF3667 domain-containing protein [Rhizomicrobium sp.]|nr:DUF3667 domain-containing protein [Rhizomicrobium sp.]
MTGDLEVLVETGSVAAIEIAASSLGKGHKQTGNCANCGHPLAGAFCASCGQPTNVHRRSVAGLVHELVVDVVNFDSRILRTTRALLFQPGELPKAFREGRTQRYVPAFRLYLFVSLIFFVLLSLTGIAIIQLAIVAKATPVIRDAKGNLFIANPAYDPIDADDKILPKLIPVDKDETVRNGSIYSYNSVTYFFKRIGSLHSTLPPDAQAELQREANGDFKKVKVDKNDARATKTKDWMSRHVEGALARVAADPAALNGPMTVWIPRALFLLLPIYALLLTLFYFRHRKQFFLVDHLVFSLSVHTFAFVALIFAAGLAQLVSGAFVAVLFFGVMAVYIFLAMKRFYEQGWIKTSIKYLLLSGTYLVFFLLPSLAGILLLGLIGDNFG